MLYYSEIAMSPLEVPGESSLCIYISGCQNRCFDCHYPELQLYDYGDPLMENLSKIIEVYYRYVTCVCFLGEGNRSDRNELIAANAYAQGVGLRTCLYSGYGGEIQNWMRQFHYLKLGAYQKSRGSLYNKRTNQRFYLQTERGYKDVTFIFWENNKQWNLKTMI